MSNSNTICHSTMQIVLSGRPKGKPVMENFETKSLVLLKFKI